MKKNIPFLLILIILTSSQLSRAQKVPLNGALFMEIKKTVLLPYFNALKDGDVIAIKHFLGPDLYQKNRVLLEQNKEYPKFLRAFYQGVIITIEKAARANGTILVDVVLEFPNGDQSFTQLSLLKYGGKSAGDPARQVWKIAGFLDR